MSTSRSGGWLYSALLTLAQAIDSLDRAVIATDDCGSIIFWGRGAESMYGWTEAVVLGRDVIDVMTGELSRGEALEIMDTLARGEPWRGEFVVRARDGSRFTVQVTDVPIYDMSGRLIGILGVSRRTRYIERL